MARRGWKRLTQALLALLLATAAAPAQAQGLPPDKHAQLGSSSAYAAALALYAKSKAFQAAYKARRT